MTGMAWKNVALCSSVRFDLRRSGMLMSSLLQSPKQAKQELEGVKPHAAKERLMMTVLT